MVVAVVHVLVVANPQGEGEQGGEGDKQEDDYDEAEESPPGIVYKWLEFLRRESLGFCFQVSGKRGD